MTVEATGTFHSYQPGAAMAAEALAGIVFAAPGELVVTHVSAATGNRTLLSEGTHYVLAGDGLAGTATIRALTTWAADDLFEIERHTNRLQQAHFPGLEAVRPRVAEAALDRLTRVDQEIERLSSTALTTATAAAALISGLIGLPGYYASFAAALADPALLPGMRFSCDEDGVLASYDRTEIAPFYVLADSYPSSALLAATGGAARIGVAGGGRLQDLLNWMTPEQFGAKGDGITDDTAAFTALSAVIQSLGFGAVRMRAGAVYIGGRQTAAKLGYRRYGEDVLSAVNLSWFVLDMNGATMKFKAGLEFGSFNPDGSVYSTMPNYDTGKRSDTGVLVRCENIQHLTVANGGFDGNSAAQVLGGPWGDTGWQCVNYGLFIAECDNTLVSNCHAVNFLGDGMAYRYNGLTLSSPIMPAMFINSSSRNSGRNTMSMVGGNGLCSIGCNWIDPGRSPHPGAVGGYVQSAPASAFDVEAEGSVISRPWFEMTTFVQGAGGNTAFVTDSGTSSGHHFKKCIFDGQVWINKPGVVLEDCTINGKFAKLYGGAEGQATELIRVTGSDTPQRGSPNPTGLFIDTGGSGSGPMLKQCQFTLARTRMGLRGIKGHDARITMALTPAIVANQGFAVLLDSPDTDITRFTFIDNLAGYTVGEGLSINANAGLLRECMIVANANYTLKWNSWSNGGGGYPRAGHEDGRYDFGSSHAFQEIRFQREANFGGGENRWAHLSFRSAAPAVGTYLAGTLVININAPVGGTAGWLLSSAGTFQPCGIVGAVQAGSVALAAGANPTKAEFDALVNALKTAKLMA